MIPSRGKKFLTTPQRPDRFWGPPSGYRGEEQLGYEADHSSPSSAEVKKGRAMPPLPHTSSWRGA
jgi:hypothetical protein